MNFIQVICQTLILASLIHPSKEVYSESLGIIDDPQSPHLRVQLNWTIGQEHLPIPLRQFSKSSIPNYLEIRYKKCFHEEENQSNDYGFNGISISLWSEKPRNSLSSYEKQLLEGTFAITIQDRYTEYLEEFSQIYSHSPNDKFCVQHIEQIVRGILPCQSNSGIIQVIDLNSLFSQDTRLLVRWNKKQMEISFTLIVRNIQKGNFIKGMRKMKIKDQCLADEDSRISIKSGKEELTLNDVITEKVAQIMLSRQIANRLLVKNKISVRRTILGNWYHQKKFLVILLKGDFSEIEEITINEILPKRARISGVFISSSNGQKKKIGLNKNMVLDQRQEFEPQLYGEMERIKIVVNKSDEFDNLTSIQISLKMDSKIGGFQDFEAILGGGTELSSFPVIFRHRNMDNFSSLTPPLVTLNTCQPDQSLPFQIITFSLACLGYVTLGIWRTFLK